MRISKLTSRVLLTGSLLISSCGIETRSESYDIISGGSFTDALELGAGYNAKTRKLTRSTCVTGEVEKRVAPRTGSRIVSEVDANYETVVDSMDGSIDASFSYAGIEAGAGAKLGRLVATSELTTNIFFSTSYIGRSDVLSGTNRRYTSNGQSLINSSIEQKETVCGTDFVYQIDRGASITVSMAIKADSKKKKDSLSGYLKVNVLDFVEVNGSLETLDESLKEGVSVRVFLKQTGGKPQNLALAIPDDGYNCSIEDLKKCVDKVNVAIKYAKTSFRSDLEDELLWAPLNYHTVPYAHTGDVKKLSQPELTLDQVELIEEAAKTLRRVFGQHMVDYEDLEFLISLSEGDERAQLEKVSGDVFKNLQRISNLIGICSNNFERCMIEVGAESLNLHDYDKKFRDLGFAAKATKFCEKLIIDAYQAGSIYEIDKNVFLLEGSAPVFTVVTDVNSRLLGVEPCINVYRYALRG